MDTLSSLRATAGSAAIQGGERESLDCRSPNGPRNDGEALRLLQQIWGYDGFRGAQAEIIDHVIAGGNAFVLMPTGGGKSLCYQIPALCRAGVGVVVSPLIALMQDQVTALTELGIRAAALHSALPPGEAATTYRALREGTLDLLYVAPERLLLEDFLTLLNEIPVALFAIDEAHCVSQWGHDFRPHYVQLSLLAERFPQVPRLALTATADAPTRRDILEKLQLDNGRVFVAGFDRPNIYYAITPRDRAEKQLLEFLRARPAGESGIVYCLSRRKTEETAAWLNEQGFTALPYHAGMDATKRAKNQDRFLREEGVIMVATIAFGMGIDKPDVRFVVHLNIPKNIEAYYQETGRAGRDGLPAETLMIYGASDASLLRGFIDDSDAPDAQKRIEHSKLNALLGLCEAAGCRRQVILEYFGDSGTPCGNCDTCLNPPETFDGTLAAQKALSCAFRTGQRFGSAHLIEVLLGKENEKITRFGHAQVSTFGIGAEFSKNEWLSIFRQLVAAGMLKVDAAGHGGLSITPQGQAFLREKQSIALRKYAGKKQSRERKPREALRPEAGVDEQLYALLKSVRLQLARERNLPPYVIFHDKTLLEMARVKPANAKELAQISGVGEKKIEHYGEIFLQAIAGAVQES